MSDDGPRDKPITTWFRFKIPEDVPLDESFFHALHTDSKEKGWTHVSYGRTQESPEDCILLVNWRYTRCWTDFLQSSHHADLLSSLGGRSEHPVVTDVIDFLRVNISFGLSSHTELKTVYFPASISPETREAVQSRVHRLRTTAAYGKGLQHLSPYVSKPSLGWVEGGLAWEGQDAVACVWVHKWKNKEAEERYKTTETFAHMKDGELIRPLTLDLFEQDLKDLGALGWEEQHFNFETTCYVP